MFYEALVNGDILEIAIWVFVFFGVALILWDTVRKWRK